MRRAVPLAALLLCACGDYREGVAVSLRATVLPTADFTTAALNIERIALHGCSGDTGGHLHAESGATVLSLRATEPVPLGRFNLDAGRYCALEVSLGPATEASAGLAGGDHGALLGATLLLASSGAELRTASAGSVMLRHEFTLDEQHREEAIALQLDAAAALAPTMADAELALSKLAAAVSLAP